MRTEVTGFVQHGIGFVGEAVIRALRERCPGMHLVGVDVEPAKVQKLSSVYGISATSREDHAQYSSCNIHAFSVPTPCAPGSRWGYDLSYLISALHYFGENILRRRDEYTLVVLRSTVYPGTSEEVLIPWLQEVSGCRLGHDFDVIFNPEFLAQERAFEDAQHPPLITYAASSDRAAELFEQCFEAFEVPFERFDTFKAAEWVKIANNSLNAVVISFMNEIRESMKGSGLSPEEAERVTLLLARTAFAKTNATYGLRDMGPFDGACLPKETQALFDGNSARGLPAFIVEAAIEMNEVMKRTPRMQAFRKVS